MNDRLIALPNDEALAAQLLSLRYDVSSSGQVKLESKRETRKRGIPSPDRADALALAFMRPPSLQIWTGNEPFLRPRDPAGVPLPPPTRDDEAPPGNGAAHIDSHSRVGGNPESLANGDAASNGAAPPVLVGW